MQIDGIEADLEQCAVAVDGSVIWRMGVKYEQAQYRRCNDECRGPHYHHVSD